MVYEQGAAAADARAAVERAGGEVVNENLAVGVATVRSRTEDFAAHAQAQPELFGAAHERGDRPGARAASAKRDEVERVQGAERREAQRGHRPKRVKGEPLADLQWDMQHDARHRRRARTAASRASKRVLGRHPRHRRRRFAPGHRAELRRER